MKKYIFIAWWVACGLVAAGGMNASLRCSFKHLTNDVTYAQHQSFSIIWGILGGPASMIWSAAMTGFYYHGWTLRSDNKVECK